MRNRPIEIRDVILEDSSVELEERGSTGPKIRGYAARFDKWSQGLPWREKIAPGAFSKTLKENDIRALWNHDPSRPLGRTSNGTLSLEENKSGLRVEIDPIDTSWGKDAVTSIRRGDVSGMSFAFETVRDEWTADFKERILREVRLFEVSPVTFPAYPSTSVGVRNDELSLTLAIARERRGCASAEDGALLESLRLELGSELVSETPPTSRHLSEWYRMLIDHKARGAK